MLHQQTTFQAYASRKICQNHTAGTPKPTYFANSSFVCLCCWTSLFT